MFGIGSGEFIILAIVILIAVGPKRLPEFMKTIGKGMREVRKATSDLRRQSGIDEVMRGDPVGLGALSRDLQRTPAPRRDQRLSASDLARESPEEGVDVAYARTRLAAERRAATIAAADAELQTKKSKANAGEADAQLEPSDALASEAAKSEVDA